MEQKDLVRKSQYGKILTVDSGANQKSKFQTKPTIGNSSSALSQSSKSNFFDLTPLTSANSSQEQNNAEQDLSDGSDYDSGAGITNAAGNDEHTEQASGENDETTEEQKLRTFHEARGHLSFAKCRKMLGMPAAKGEELSCEYCDRVKAKKQPTKKFANSRASKPIYRLFIDLSGKKQRTGKGYQYFQLVVDDNSRKRFVQLLKTKDEVLAKFKSLIKKLRKLKPGFCTAKVRTDGAKEYLSDEWEQYLDEEGISPERSAPYRQDQNGVVERSMGLVWQGAKTMMLRASSPGADWPYAVKYMVFLLNITPTSSNDGLTPDEVFEGVKRHYELNGVFGCLAIAKDYTAGKSKINNGVRCIYLGRDETCNAYLLRPIEGNCRKVKYCAASALDK